MAVELRWNFVNNECGLGWLAILEKETGAGMGNESPRSVDNEDVR
jgi:hypothetical protein